jgi:hypothetical protein
MNLTSFREHRHRTAVSQYAGCLSSGDKVQNKNRMGIKSTIVAKTGIQAS